MKIIDRVTKIAVEACLIFMFAALPLCAETSSTTTTGKAPKVIYTLGDPQNSSTSQNSSSDQTNTSQSKSKYISAFGDDYSKPKPKAAQNSDTQVSAVEQNKDTQSGAAASNNSDTAGSNSTGNTEDDFKTKYKMLKSY